MTIFSTTTPYRRDIDGLRAVAVMLVILFHSGIKEFSSGFIGVDIFFVISGYLISGVILTQIREERFSLSEFLNRRLWRIQPALIVVTLITLVAASALYIVPDYLSFVKSAKYNSLFTANQFFAKQSATYASPQSEFFPLLHTWSLSVEWQWYLFLSLFFYALILFSKRTGSSFQWKVSKDSFLTTIWLLVTVIFACASLVISNKYPGASYYSLAARAFEFTAGGSVFLLNRIVKSVYPKLLTALSSFAVIVILIISTKEGIIDIYPNGWTVVAVLCSGIILFSGHYQEKIVSGVLSWRLMSFTGKMSYSLYLWHWPVLVFCRYSGITLERGNLVTALAVIVMLSMISYFLVEHPLRRKKLSLPRTFLLLVLLPIIFYCGLYSLTVKYSGFPQRLGDEYARQQSILEHYSALAGNRDKCLDRVQEPGKCLFGDLNGHKKALVIGDSNSNHFWGFLDVLGKESGTQLSAISTASCLAFPGVWQYDWWIYRNITYKKCHENTERYYQLIRQNHYDYVIVGEVWEQYAKGPHLINDEGDERSDELSKFRMNNAVREALNIITNSGARPIFIKTIRSMPPGYRACINNVAIKRENFENSSCNTPRTIGDEDYYISSLFNQMQREYPDLIIIDPKAIQCPDGKCVSQIDGVPLYRDVGHLTDYASYRLGEIYSKTLVNPFVR